MGLTRVVNRRREPCDVVIERPGPWGNPFFQHSRQRNIADYRRWLLTQPELVERARRELRGKVLGCSCKPRACHGDVLAEVADS